MKIRSFIVVPLLTVCYDTIIAQSIRKLDDNTVAQLNQVISDQFSSGNLPGLSVGIVYGGEVVYANGWGNEEPGVPFTTSTKSLLASVSKTITGVMAMKMIEQGHMSLDANVNSYLPSYPASRGITIRHLLSHQSGIAHYSDCPSGYDGPFEWSASQEVVEGCTRCLTPPGSGTLYTTFGTTLLGAAIEKVGLSVYGKNFTQLYNDWLKTPGNLTNLDAAFDDSDPLLSRGYDESGSITSDGWEDIGWKLPAGGFISDIVSLAKYGKCILRNTFITQTSLSQMMQVQNTSGTPNMTCGTSSSTFGLAFVVESSGDDLRISHTGINSDHGYSSFLYLYPPKGAGSVFLSNKANVTNNLSAISVQIEGLVLCPSNREFTSNITWTAPGIYEASQTITASSEIVPISGEYIFDAKNSVTLNPGFHAKTGIQFRAVLEGCGGIIKSF